MFCFAAETGGRLHSAADQELRRLASLARDRSTEAGIRHRVFLRRWRHQLVAALARSVAAALLAASAGHGSNGRLDEDNEEADLDLL